MTNRASGSLVRKETKWGHSYRLDGRACPGVTTLIGKGVPKPALPRWAAKTVAEFVADSPEQVEALRAMGRGPTVDALKAVPWQSRDVAAARGTDVHAIADKLIHGEEVEVPQHLASYVAGYVDWLDTYAVEALWTERPCANRKWLYAGTFDAIVRMRGQLWLLDWKTSAGVYGETALQLSAYRNSEFLLGLDGEEVPMPEVDRLGVVHVRPDGSDLYEVRDPEAAWKDFLHAAWTAKAEDRIKNQLVRVDDEGQEIA